MDSNCHHTLQKRQQFNDGKYHGIGSLADSRASTSPPSQRLPNDIGSLSSPSTKITPNEEGDSKSSDEPDDETNQDSDSNDDVDSEIDSLDDDNEDNAEEDLNLDSQDDNDDDNQNQDQPPAIPPSSDSAEDAPETISDSSTPDFKVAYLSPIFIIGGLVAIFTIIGLVYRRRRRNRLAKERQVAMENGSSEDNISEFEKPTAFVSEGHLDQELRHSSWQTDDDAQMMSPNSQPFVQSPGDRVERPWMYQPSGLSSQSFRNEPWKWPSNNNTPRETPKPTFQRTNSSFQPPSQITDEILKSPLPEGYQDASPEDVDRRLDEMSDRGKHNSGSMAFYANAMKSALDGERYKSGFIGNKILSRRPTTQMDGGGDAQIRQRKTSDKQAQQIAENDDINYIPSMFSPPLRSSTPWGDFSQAIKTVFNPPKREPTPAAAGFFKRSNTPANVGERDIELDEAKETKSPVDNVLTPISKDIQSPVPISYEQLKNESNTTNEDAKDTKDTDSPPPPLPKSPDRHVKKSKKSKLSKSRSKDIKNTIAMSSPISMNAVVNENVDLSNQHYPNNRSTKGKEKMPHSPLLEQLAKSPVPLSPNFAQLAKSDESDVDDDGPYNTNTVGQSKFYTVKDMKNIRDEFTDEAAKLRDMAITPFVKNQGAKDINYSIHTVMKETESQLTPPGLSPEPQQVLSPVQQDADLAELPFLPSPPLAGKKVHPPSWSLEAQIPKVVSPPPKVVSPPPNIVSPPPVQDWQNLPETLRSPPPQAVRSEMIFQANANQAPPQSFGAALSTQQPQQPQQPQVQNRESEKEIEENTEEPEIETWSEGSGSTVFYEDETYQDDGIINIGRNNDGSNEGSRADSIGGGSTRSKIRRYKTRRSAMSTSTRYKRASQMTAPALIEENVQYNNNAEQQQMVVNDWRNVEINRSHVSAPPAVNKPEDVSSPQSDDHFTSPLSGGNTSPSKHTDGDFKSPMSDAFKSSESTSPKFKSPASSDFLPTIEATPELARSSTMKNYLMRLPSIRQSTGMGSIGMNSLNSETLPSPMYDSYNSGNSKYNFIGKGQDQSKHDSRSPSDGQEDSHKALAKVDEILTTSWSSRISSDDFEEPPRKRGAAVAPRTRKLLEARMRRERSGSPTSSLAESDYQA